VAVIDGSTQTKIAAVPVGQYPGVAAIDTTTNEIYVTNNSSNSVTIIDGNTNNTTTVIADTQPWSVVVNQNAHVAYVLNQRNSSLGSVFVIPSQKQSAPQITVSPLDQQVSVGATVTFTAAGTGTPTPTVKWQVSTDGGATYNDVPGQTTTTLTFTALASQNGYKYRAMFTNSGGSTPTSAATLTVILPVLTVTVNNAERAYGAPTPAFTVSYSGFVNGDTQAVLSGSPSIATTATANSPFGSYPITATQGTLAASNYTFNFVAGTLTVDKATLTITANSLPKTYGAVTTFAGTEFTTIGLVNGDTVTSVSLSSSGAVATATVGPYNIVPSNAVGTGLGNYNISYVNGTLSVGAANLSITASNRSKTYGNTVTFAGTEFTTIGLVNGNTVTSVSLSSSGAVATATVGPYNIVPSNAVGTGLGNYNISYLNGTLSVGAANLSITASNRSKTYGNTVTFAGTEFTTIGLVNGNTVTSVSLSSSGAVATATVGPYNIVPSNAVGTGLGNYNISYLNGTLTVGPANLTVTANNASRGVGAANPVFTASYSGFMNGQTATVLSGSPVFSTTATSSSPAGLYPIYDSLGTLTAANYTFSFVSGTLSVVAPSVVQLVVTTSVVKQLGGFQATITVTNNGSGAASNVQLTTAILGTAPGSPVPVSLGTIAGGGASAKTVITFPSSAGTSGSTAVAKYSGAYNGGTFSSSLRVVLP
jgi:YVTN family beta-propeller protein